MSTPAESDSTRFPDDGLTRTPRLRDALDTAATVARDSGHTWVGTEHVTIAILRDPASIPAQELRRMGLDPNIIAEQLLAALDGDAYRTPTNRARFLDGHVSDTAPR